MISNPCETTSIDALSLGSTTLTVTDGDTTSTTWSVPDVQVDADKLNTGLCGLVAFDVFTDTSDSVLSLPWAVISDESGGTYQLTIDTNQNL